MDENTNIQIILQSMDTQIKTGFHGYDKDSTKEYINGLITNSKSEINGLNKIIDDLRNNNGRLKAELEEAVANYNNLLNKKEDPSKDIEIKKLKKEIEELQSELNKVQIKDSNTTSLHDENLELKNIVASQDDELNELKTHVSLLNKKIKELNNETKTKELENATKNVKLEKDFRALQADYEIVKKQLDVANDRIKSYTEQLDSGEINKLREALDASNKQVEQMTEMVKDEEAKHALIEKQNKVLSAKNTTLNGTIADMQKNISDLNTELEKANKYNEVLENEVKALYVEKIKLNEKIVESLSEKANV